MVQIISLGMGVQSTALYLMSSIGELPRVDLAIFADTGKEGKATYEYLSFLQQWQQQHNGIPIAVLRDKDLFADLMGNPTRKRFTSIPAYTSNEDNSIGMLRRQCTSEYKIHPVDNFIRDHVYHLPKGARRPMTAVWHGITLDESGRISVPLEAWKLNTYPFLGRMVDKTGALQHLPWSTPMTRQEVIRWYLLHALPVPPKSACVFCPYHSDHAWAMKKRFAPEDFRAAVAVDEAIRNSGSKGILNPVYLHRSCRPLAEVVFKPGEDEPSGECSGICHV